MTNKKTIDERLKKISHSGLVKCRVPECFQCERDEKTKLLIHQILQEKGEEMIKEIEKIVPKEKYKRCEKCETFSDCDCMEYSHAFNSCRAEILSKLEALKENI